MRNVTDLKENECIYIGSQEKYNRLLEQWKDNHKFVSILKRSMRNNGVSICISHQYGCYEWSIIDWFKNNNFNILPATDFLPTGNVSYQEGVKTPSYDYKPSDSPEKDVESRLAALEQRMVEIEPKINSKFIDNLEVTHEEVKELTELPEKWCIKVNAEHPEIGKWFNDNNTYNSASNYNHEGFYDTFLHYPHYIDDDNDNFHYGKIIEKGYTEITLSQFKKWVLKEDEIDWSVPGQVFEYNGIIVMNSGSESETQFYGMCLKHNHFEDVGKYMDYWNKSLFKLLPKGQTITVGNE